MEYFKKIDSPVAYEIPDSIPEDKVIILPQRINEDGVSLYANSSMELYKELRDEVDIDVDYLNTPGGQKWIEQFGSGEEQLAYFILSFPMSVLASAAWYAIQRFLIEKVDKKNMKVKIVITHGKTESERDWFELEGSPKELKEIVDKIIENEKSKK